MSGLPNECALGKSATDERRAWPRERAWRGGERDGSEMRENTDATGVVKGTMSIIQHRVLQSLKAQIALAKNRNVCTKEIVADDGMCVCGT